MGTMKPARIVLLSVGVFNPPTNLHLRIFELARDYLHRKGTQVIGGIISPVHDKYGKKGLLPSHHRCEMVRRAVQTSDWIHVSDWEAKQEEWNRTAVSLQYHKDTINQLGVANPPSWVASIQKQVCDQLKEEPVDVKVKLLCGADLLESFAVPGLWKDSDIEDIVTNYGLVVVTRSGSDPRRFIYESDLLTKLESNIIIVPEWITNEVSSTKIRRALGRGESVKYLIQDSVLEYIQQHQLYSQAANV